MEIFLMENKPAPNDVAGWAKKISETIREYQRMGLLTKEQADEACKVLQ